MGVTGIILAGGKSSRMGKDKGLIPLAGKQLASYSIQALKSWCDPIMISSNNPLYEEFGYDVFPDVEKGLGPLGGIYSGFKKNPGLDIFVLSCDMPLISSALIGYILKCHGDYDAVVPVFQKYPEPMCAYYSKNAYGPIQRNIKDANFKVQDVLNNMNTLYLQIDTSLEFYHPDLFANVNNKDELLRIENMILKSGMNGD